MDVKRSRSPRAPADDDRKRAGGWRGSGGVRPEMVLVGFLLTLPLLFLVFGGRWGSSSFPSSSATTSSPSPPVVSKPVARHVDAGGDRRATPQGQSKLPSCPLHSVAFWPVNFGDRVARTVARRWPEAGHAWELGILAFRASILRRGLAYECRESLFVRMQFSAPFCSSWRKANWRFVGSGCSSASDSRNVIVDPFVVLAMVRWQYGHWRITPRIDQKITWIQRKHYGPGSCRQSGFVLGSLICSATSWTSDSFWARVGNSDPTCCVQQQHCNSEFVDMYRGDPVFLFVVSATQRVRRRDAITPVHDASLPGSCPASSHITVPSKGFCANARFFFFFCCSSLVVGPTFCLSGPWLLGDHTILK